MKLLAHPPRLRLVWNLAEVEAANRRKRWAAAIEAEMRRQGILDRCRAVDAAIQTPEFGQRFGAAFDAVKHDPDRHCRNEDDVRALAFRVLGEMGVDTADVHTVVFLHPDGRIRFGPEDVRAPLTTSPTIQARNRCIAALELEVPRARATLGP